MNLTGAYIKFVEEEAGDFYKFFKKKFLDQETIELNISYPVIFSENISWPLPLILVSYLRLVSGSIWR